MDSRVYRIGRHLQEFSQHGGNGRTKDKHDEFTRHVQNVMRALLREAGTQFDRPEIVRLIFPRFEYAARRLRPAILSGRRSAGNGCHRRIQRVQPVRGRG